MKLPLLSGTADGKHWSFKSTGPDVLNAGLAIFAIAAFHKSQPEIIGTGFYISGEGVFITARHVVEEIMSIGSDHCKIVSLFPDGIYIFRPFGAFFNHQSADISIGYPQGLKKNGAPYVGKRIPISFRRPDIGTPISTWSYPRHKVTVLEEQTNIYLEPDFYDGTIEEYYEDRGPSRKIDLPYFQTNMHLHGSASGGPVFDPSGSAFGVASTSYDGAVDFSFVTPLFRAAEIVITLTIDGQEQSKFFGEVASTSGLLA